MKKILNSILAFFSARVIVTIPGGIVPDNSGAWGLFGFMQNVNSALARGIAAITTSGTSVTLTAAQLLSGVVQLNAGASNDYTINLPSTSKILTALGNTIPTDGTFSMLVRFNDSGTGHTGTVTAGDASTTVSGTATVATSTTRTYVLNVASGGATITLTNIGTATL